MEEEILRLRSAQAARVRRVRKSSKAVGKTVLRGKQRTLIVMMLLDLIFEIAPGRSATSRTDHYPPDRAHRFTMPRF